MGHSLWGCRESDVTEQLILSRKRWKLDKLLVLRSLKCDKARRAMIRVSSKFPKKKKKHPKKPNPSRTAICINIVNCHLEALC